MLCTLESSCLLDDDKEKEDDEDIEEDDKADVPCKWFSLADQLLLVPLFFLDGNNSFKLINFIKVLVALTGQSMMPSHTRALLIFLKRSLAPQFLQYTVFVTTLVSYRYKGKVIG